MQWVCYSQSDGQFAVSSTKDNAYTGSERGQNYTDVYHFSLVVAYGVFTITIFGIPHMEQQVISIVQKSVILTGSITVMLFSKINAPNTLLVKIEFLPAKS